MKDKKILYVSSEVVPYLPETEISSMSFEAPRMVNQQGGQIRIFMPKYGNINERRHQLHEVIRLSGINLVINDLDMPLIVTSVYNQTFDDTLNKDMLNKIKFDNIEEEAIKGLEEPTYTNLMKVAVDYSDALIVGSENIPESLEAYIKESNKPMLEHKSKEEFGEAYTEFINTKVLS